MDLTSNERFDRQPRTAVHRGGGIVLLPSGPYARNCLEEVFSDVPMQDRAWIAASEPQGSIFGASMPGGRPRATVISLFAAALFAGSGVATMAAAPLAEAGSFDLLFALAALVAVPLGLFAALARHRYSGNRR
jgi:hypothetical protein